MQAGAAPEHGGTAPRRGALKTSMASSATQSPPPAVADDLATSSSASDLEPDVGSIVSDADGQSSHSTGSSRDVAITDMTESMDAGHRAVPLGPDYQATVLPTPRPPPGRQTIGTCRAKCVGGCGRRGAATIC